MCVVRVFVYPFNLVKEEFHTHNCVWEAMGDREAAAKNISLNSLPSPHPLLPFS